MESGVTRKGKRQSEVISVFVADVMYLHVKAHL